MKKSFLRKQIFHRHSMNYVVLFPYAKNIKKVLPRVYLSNWLYQLTRKIKKSFLITALILSASEVDQKFRIKNRYHNVLSDKPTFLLVYLSLFGKRLWCDTLFVTLKTATLIKNYFIYAVALGYTLDLTFNLVWLSIEWNAGVY